MRSPKGKGHTTIIKRSSRKSHDAIHGGAWKVAFADFTLAMMALFMVLWIMGSVTEEERKEIVSTLNSESIFDGMSINPITQKNSGGGSNPILEGKRSGDENTEGSGSGSDNGGIKSEQPKQSVADIVNKTESLEEVNKRSQQEMEELARIILQVTSAYNAQTNMKMEIVPQGLRILVQDDQKREMFQRSSAILTPFFNRLLRDLAPVFNKLDNKIIITGHTDSLRYRDQDLYNNWNLSGDRAMAARKALARGGLEMDKVLQVNAMADQMLLDNDQPLSATNRRIEIMVLTHTASDSLYQFFGNHGDKVVKPIADKISKR